MITIVILVIALMTAVVLYMLFVNKGLKSIILPQFIASIVSGVMLYIMLFELGFKIIGIITIITPILFLLRMIEVNKHNEFKEQIQLNFK